MHLLNPNPYSCEYFSFFPKPPFTSLSRTEIARWACKQLKFKWISQRYFISIKTRHLIDFQSGLVLCCVKEFITQTSPAQIPDWTEQVRRGREQWPCVSPCQDLHFKGTTEIRYSYSKVPLTLLLQGCFPEKSPVEQWSIQKLKKQVCGALSVHGLDLGERNNPWQTWTQHGPGMGLGLCVLTGLGVLWRAELELWIPEGRISWGRTIILWF